MLLISKIVHNAPEIFYYDVLFNKVICGFEQGNACLARDKTQNAWSLCWIFTRNLEKSFSFKTFDYCFLKGRMDYLWRTCIFKLIWRKVSSSAGISLLTKKNWFDY